MEENKNKAHYLAKANTNQFFILQLKLEAIQSF